MDKRAITFNSLDWDTDFFGVTSAKATLHKPLTSHEWYELKQKFQYYQFISLLNKNSEPINARFIGEETKAYLVDVNIQFKKELTGLEEKLINETVTIKNGMKKSLEILEMADFKYSKFIEDLELEKRGGNQVYRQWLINAFEKKDKFFAISTNEKNEINGYLLYSFSNNVCIIELIAVSQKTTKGGIGTSLFRAVEYDVSQRGMKEIRVGTQVRNMEAINFYHKMHCKQIGCHQVYHLWNI